MKQNQIILVVEDEQKISEVLAAYLEKNGYTPLVAATGKEALHLFDAHHISLVLLDLMLPDMMGEDVCRKIRLASRVPIIMLTAKVGESNLLAGLEIGADDYLTKPFSPRTVIAKIKAVLRRVESDELVSVPISFDNGRLIIDFQNQHVTQDGTLVKLTPTEYKLLCAMAKAPNRVFTRDQLIVHALNNDYDGYDRSIDTYIMGLRAKIEPNRKIPRYIITVHGMGYRFCDSLGQED